METKKAITIGVVAIILIATVAVFAVKIARKNSSVSNPAPVAGTKSTSKTGSAGQAVTQSDSDIKAVEDDLDSISEEDFGDNSLSDSAVGL